MRYEPPAHLAATLENLALGGQRDLRAVRARVRRLTRDLPAFDQVWIDALVQARRITPFQAGWLAAQDQAALKVGPFVLVDRLGRSDLAETYLARPAGRSRRVALKVINPDLVPGAGAQQHLEPVLSKLASLKCRHLAVPSSWGVADGRFYVATPWVRGPNSVEMLIHSGRLAPAAVAEVARQLLAALTCLWAQDMAHGDVRPSHVRITGNGKVMLTDAAIRLALPQAALLPMRSLPPERFDYLSPESFASGQASNPSADQYALGCLLWHLLAGRPPFPGADADAKRVTRQCADVPDVRAIAPMTPAPLAELIAALTRRDPQERPCEHAALARKLPAPRAAGRKQLARLGKALGRRWRYQVRPRRRWLAIAATAFAALALALPAASTATQGRWKDALAWMSDWRHGGTRPQSAAPAPNREADVTDSPPRQPPLAPAAASADNGEQVVVLTEQVYRVQGTYLKPPRQPGRRLALEPGQRVLGNGRPVLVLDDGPLHITEPGVQWENVRFVLARTPRGTAGKMQALVVVDATGCRFRRCSFELQDAQELPSALVLVNGVQASFVDCVFEGPADAMQTQARQLPAAIVWQSRPGAESTLEQPALPEVELTGCNLQRLSAAVAVTANASPRVELRQSVLRASSELVRIDVLGESRGRVAIRLSGCTTYDAHAVLEVGYRSVPEDWPGCALWAEDCEFHFETEGGATGRQGTLVSFRGAAKPDAATLHKIQWSGTGSAVISPTDVPEAVWDRGDQTEPLKGQLAIEGLARGRSAPRRAAGPAELP